MYRSILDTSLGFFAFVRELEAVHGTGSMFTDFMSKFWQTYPTEVKFSALTKFHSECLSNAIFLHFATHSFRG